MEVDKMLEVGKNLKIRISIKEVNNIYSSSYEIAEFKNGEIDKIISFNEWDDYGFEAMCFNSDIDKINNIDFIIKKDNPLYHSLNKFLDTENLIIIDDDTTREINKKAMLFIRNGEEIIVRFSNELGQNELEKFNIFVKNILTDYRSKIDDGEFDTKDRLYRLFENLREDLCPETLEECPVKSDEITMKLTHTKNLKPNNGK